MRRANTLQKLFSFPGFRARHRLRGLFGDPVARVIELERRKKGLSALAAGSAISLSTIESRGKRATYWCWAGTFTFASRGGE